VGVVLVLAGFDDVVDEASAGEAVANRQLVAAEPDV